MTVTLYSIWKSRTGLAIAAVAGPRHPAAQELIRDDLLRNWRAARASSASVIALRKTEIMKMEENHFTELMELYHVAQPV